MNQPPRKRTLLNRPSDPANTPPTWRRPRGVSIGTWQYVHQRSIADHYDEFVADTPLCALDSNLLTQIFPAVDASETILDLGCGSGRAAIPLATRGYSVIGIDLSQRMLRAMMQKSEPDLELFPIRSNLVELECLGDQVADHAICLFSTLGMIQGHENRKQFLCHVARIIRPGGKLVVHVHNRWSALREPRGMRTLVGNWMRSLLQRDGIELGDHVYRYRGLESMFMHRFSHGELNRLLQASGWRIDRAHRLNLNGSSTQGWLGIPGGFIMVCSPRVASAA
jgi:SAM-dependent methyltransferase